MQLSICFNLDVTVSKLFSIFLLLVFMFFCFLFPDFAELFEHFSLFSFPLSWAFYHGSLCSFLLITKQAHTQTHTWSFSHSAEKQYSAASNGMKDVIGSFSASFCNGLLICWIYFRGKRPPNNVIKLHFNSETWPEELLRNIHYSCLGIYDFYSFFIPHLILLPSFWRYLKLL